MGLPWRRCSGQGPHPVKTLEPRRFSQVASGFSKTCSPLLLPPSIFPSIRVFSNESALCSRWPKYWSFSINPSNEYSGLISFRMDWFDLFAVQGTLKSLLQHHNLKASTIEGSASFMVQLSHPYIMVTMDQNSGPAKPVVLVQSRSRDRIRCLLGPRSSRGHVQVAGSHGGQNGPSWWEAFTGLCIQPQD